MDKTIYVGMSMEDYDLFRKVYDAVEKGTLVDKDELSLHDFLKNRYRVINSTQERDFEGVCYRITQYSDDGIDIIVKERE